MKCYLTTKLLIVILIYRCNAQNSVLVSWYKEASQSSTHGSGAVASYAVDGRTDGNFPQKTCTHTVAGDNDPWWYVDLGASIAVSKIVIYNRVDCCGSRLIGAIVRVGDDNASPFYGNAQCGPTLTSSMIDLNPIEIICSTPIAGKYVTVFLPGTDPLTLCEVEVYTELVSRYKAASQSSTHGSGAVASYAVDGRTNGNFPQKTCTHTVAGGNDPWWYVDLGASVVVSKIVIYNRVDCCANRLTGAVIRVGDNDVSPFPGNTQCGTTLTSSMVGSNPIEINCIYPIAGRYVSVFLPGTEPLTLCEVEVYTGC